MYDELELESYGDSEWGTCSDTANALRIAERFQYDLRYVSNHGWYRYEGHRMVHLEGPPLDEGMALPDLIRSEINGSISADDANALRKWADKSASEARIRAALSLATDLRTIRASVDQLNRDPLSLNTPVGVFDLTRGESQETLAKDMLTKSTGHIPAGLEKGVVWQAFLERVLPKPHVRSFLQRAIGYSLTGLTREEVFFILFGDGQNGKSKLLSAVAYALGDYSHAFDPKLVTQQKYDGHPTNIASLFGVRFAYSSEIDQGATLDEGRVKAITGGDKMTARFMRKDEFSWSPTHKLWIASNHLPVIKGQDKGMWRRVLVLPFEVTIPDNERDNLLEEKLQAEAGSILTWCIEGAQEYLRCGLNPPAEVLMASAAYQQEQDTIQKFLAECTTPQPGVKCPSGDLRLAYKRWAEDHGYEVLNDTKFGKELTRLGFPNKDDNGNDVYDEKGKRSRKGLVLNDEARSWV